MPKRQAKVIFQAPKKQQKIRFKIPRFSVPMGFIIILLVAAFGIELSKTPFATANQLPSTEPSTLLFATNVILSPTPKTDIALPLIENLEQSLVKQPEASEEAALSEDYCVDVPVLTYHHIQPLEMADKLGHKVLTADSKIFEDQIRYLSENGYTALDAHDLVIALETKTTLPEKSIIITIDDGYDDNYTYAFMIAKKYQFIMNFMIPTGLIGKPGYMQWDHLHELKESPYASIYNHTTSHAPLGYITKDKIIEEVTRANNDLYTQLGLENKIVTYPYGAYDDEAVTTLKELDMSAAFTTDHGSKHCLSNIMKLPRIRIGNAPMSAYGF